MLSLTGKNVVVIGGSRGVGRRIVEAASRNGARVLAMARQEAPLRQLAQEVPGIEILALDATDEGAPSKVFSVLTPDVLVLNGGAFPPAAPIHEQRCQDRIPLPEGGAIATPGSRQLGCLDLLRRRARRLAEFRRLCRRQAHADVHGELQPEGIGSSWARPALPRACAADDAGHRSRQARGRGLRPLSRGLRGRLRQEHGSAADLIRCRDGSDRAGDEPGSLQGDRVRRLRQGPRSRDGVTKIEDDDRSV